MKTKEEIKNIVSYKHNEVFKQIQDEENIKTGDIDPLLASELDDIEGRIAEIVIAQIEDSRPE